MSNGKGSKPRPLSVSQEVFQQNWDAIFTPKTESVALENNTDTQTQPKKKRKQHGK